MERFEAVGLKPDTHSVFDEYMKNYEYRRSVLFDI